MGVSNEASSVKTVSISHELSMKSSSIDGFKRVAGNGGRKVRATFAHPVSESRFKSYRLFMEVISIEHELKVEELGSELWIVIDEDEVVYSRHKSKEEAEKQMDLTKRGLDACDRAENIVEAGAQSLAHDFEIPLSEAIAYIAEAAKEQQNNQ